MPNKIIDVLDEEFKECPTCKSKSGTPILCDSCSSNRFVISRLKEEVRKLRQDNILLVSEISE